MKLRRTLFIIVFALVIVDQLTKYVAETTLEFGVLTPIAPVFSLVLAYNKGVAFSALSWVGNTGLIVMTLVILAGLYWLWRKVPVHKQLAHLGFALIFAGAIGNLIDRMARGQVVDFFYFHTQNWAFAVFNVADSFITIGAIAIIIDELFSGRSGEPDRKSE
ncbi:MAG: signal peptidase II [Ahrensia sp.]|nr:signal peptidase II [Ahrensia sp.]